LINGKGYSSFDRSELYSYWNGFFIYENSSLITITEKEFNEEIAVEKRKAKPFIDSQQIINIILMRLSRRQNFHELFHELFHDQLPEANEGSILGMQLYTLILKDDKDWCYFVPKHPGHLFAHATYFIPLRRDLKDT